MKKLFLILLMMGLAAGASASDKSWNAEGDQADWFDPANWLSAGVPSSSDDVKIDMQDASVQVGQTYEAQSLVLGGKKDSTVSISNFTTGRIEPAAESEDAVVARRGGKLILKGSAGKLTVKGAYKDSEEIIPGEPSFLVYVQ